MAKEVSAPTQDLIDYARNLRQDWLESKGDYPNILDVSHDRTGVVIAVMDGVRKEIVVTWGELAEKRDNFLKLISGQIPSGSLGMVN